METINEFFEKAKTAKKIIVPRPSGGSIPYMSSIAKNEKFFILRGHRKGNHWNLGGNQYLYLHDVNTGEFIESCNGCNGMSGISSLKWGRITVKDYKKFETIMVEQHKNNQI